MWKYLNYEISREFHDSLKELNLLLKSYSIAIWKDHEEFIWTKEMSGEYYVKSGYEFVIPKGEACDCTKKV